MSNNGPKAHNSIDNILKKVKRLPEKLRNDALADINQILSEKYEKVNSNKTRMVGQHIDTNLRSRMISSTSSYNVEDSGAINHNVLQNLTIENLSQESIQKKEKFNRKLKIKPQEEFKIVLINGPLQSIDETEESTCDNVMSDESSLLNSVLMSFNDEEQLKDSNLDSVRRRPRQMCNKVKKAQGCGNAASHPNKHLVQTESGYFINCPVQEEEVYPDYSQIENELLDHGYSKEINIDIHCQEPSKKGRAKKGTNSTMSKAMKCSLCDYVTKKKQLLTQHMTRHTGFKPHICSLCGKSFQQLSGLKIHEMRHMGERNFSCDFCTFKTYTKIDIQRHMVQHVSSKEYICQYCGKFFSLESTLRVHIKTIHEKADQYACDQCKFTTYHKNNLRLHDRTHHGDGIYKYICPICQVRIQQKSTYIDHMRSHTGERPYGCDTCGKAFACQGRLNVHNKTVHGVRTFLCQLCNKTFQTSHHLTRHKLTHTKQKPFKCIKCEYACNTQGNLTKHLKSSHDITDYSFKKSKKGELQDATMAQQCIENGQMITAKYLEDFSAKLGKEITIDELKIQQEEMNKKPVITKKKEVKEPKRARKPKSKPKIEHSYHLMDFGQLEENLCPKVISHMDTTELVSLKDSNTNLYEDIMALNNVENNVNKVTSSIYEQMTDKMYLEETENPMSVETGEETVTFYQVDDDQVFCTDVSINNQVNTTDDIIQLYNNESNNNVFIIKYVES